MIVDTNLPQKIETKLGGEYNVESVINDDGSQTLNIKYVESAYENKFNQLVNRTIREVNATDLKDATTIQQYLFQGISTLQKVELPDSVTSIGYRSFMNCTGLEKVVFGNNVKTIDGYAFYDTSISGELIIPESVTSMSNDVFGTCHKITRAIINSSSSIPSSAFRNCSLLSNVIVGSGVTTIGSYAFSGCDTLIDITMKSATPPKLVNVNAFPSYETFTTIYIPVGTLEAYSTATNWSSFADKFVEKEM